jgi:hypothetical protein
MNINFANYRPQDLAGRIDHILSAPISAQKKIIVYVVAFCAIGLVLGFVCSGNSWETQNIVGLVVGLVFCAIAGFCWGYQAALGAFKTAMQKLFGTLAEIAKQIIADVRKLFQANGEGSASSTDTVVNNLPSLNSTVNGVAREILDPCMKQVLNNRIPLLGGMLYKGLHFIEDKALRLLGKFLDGADATVRNRLALALNANPNNEARLATIEREWIAPMDEKVDEAVQRSKKGIASAVKVPVYLLRFACVVCTVIGLVVIAVLV